MQPSQKPEAFDRCIRESVKSSCAATLGPAAAKPLTLLRLACDFPWSLRRSGAPTRTRTWNPLLRRQVILNCDLSSNTFEVDSLEGIYSRHFTYFSFNSQKVVGKTWGKCSKLFPNFSPRPAQNLAPRIHFYNDIKTTSGGIIRGTYQH